MGNSKWLNADEFAKEREDGVKKNPYRELIDLSNLPKGQQTFAVWFNEMRQTLIDNNLMDAK